MWLKTHSLIICCHSVSCMTADYSLWYERIVVSTARKKEIFHRRWNRHHVAALRFWIALFARRWSDTSANRRRVHNSENGLDFTHKCCIVRSHTWHVKNRHKENMNAFARAPTKIGNTTKRGKFVAERLTRYRVINFDGIRVADESKNGIKNKNWNKYRIRAICFTFRFALAMRRRAQPALSST